MAELAPNALESEALLAFLERAPEEIASLSEIDGILTAIAIGPEEIPADEWLPVVWGDADPQFAGTPERLKVLGAFRARLEEIVSTLSEAPPAYAPLFWAPEEEGGAPDATDWAHGFMLAVEVRAEAWRKFLRSEQAEAMEPIYAHLPEEAEALEGLSEAEAADVLAEAAALIPQSVAFVYEHFRRKRLGRAVRAEQAARPAPPERNAPCPCGSGAKYKKCCGAAA